MSSAYVYEAFPEPAPRPLPSSSSARRTASILSCSKECPGNIVCSSATDDSVVGPLLGGRERVTRSYSTEVQMKPRVASLCSWIRTSDLATTRRRPTSRFTVNIIESEEGR
jgi:hypothetical protein